MLRLILHSLIPGDSRDFLRMGRGIEARYERCKQWWDPHLKCSREFISQNIKPAKKVLILGAGRLLDVDLSYVRERTEEVYLYDADSSCQAAWERSARGVYGSSVKGCIADCTETLNVWTSGLSKAVAEGTLAEYLRACQAPIPAWSREGFDGIISLNILGQIPLYWRDRVVCAKQQLSDAEALSLEASMAELQMAHLRGVSQGAKAWSIVLTDTEYYFYQSDSSAWRVERALYGGCEEQLRQQHPRRAPGQSWFWHVSPQFVECDDEGEIHRVEAFVHGF